MTVNTDHLWKRSDAELARGAKEGASACFEELVRRYQVPLMRYLGRRFSLRGEAEDVLRERSSRRL